MQLGLWILVSIGASILVVEAVRRLPARVGLGVFVAVPIVVTPFWIGEVSVPLLSTIKVYSVCAAAAYIQAMRLERRPARAWAQRLGFVILAINIGEAVVAAIADGAVSNAAAGALLVLTQASPEVITVDGPGTRRDLRYALSGGWIAAYTVWNLGFVYGHRPESTALALIHLAAPLLASRGSTDRWMQARTLVLAFVMIVRVSFPWPPFFYETPGWYVPAIATALHLAALGLASIVAARALRPGAPWSLLGALRRRVTRR